MIAGMVVLLRCLRGRVDILQSRSALLSAESKRLRKRSAQLPAHSTLRERVLRRLCRPREMAV